MSQNSSCYNIYDVKLGFFIFMDGSMDGWIDGLTEGQTNGRKGGNCNARRTNGWIHGYILNIWRFDQ